MDRKKLLIRAFQRGKLLSMNSSFYREWINKFIIDEIKGDIGKKGDITSKALIRNKRKFNAVVFSRENGVIAGIEEVSFLYKKNKVNIKPLKKDGEKIKKNEKILTLTGKAEDLLRTERPALDLLQRMSGIATLTQSLIKKVGKNTMIAPTRKTQWRYLDKKAVYCGGGLTHRLALWDSILIKDTHLKVLETEKKGNPIEISLDRAWKKRKSSTFIEVEVDSKENAVIAASKIKSLIQKDKKVPYLIMLDNMSTKEIKKTILSLKNKLLLENILIEASGGINPKNIVEYSKTGVDVISLGYLTHSSHALDIKQKII